MDSSEEYFKKFVSYLFVLYTLTLYRAYLIFPFIVNKTEQLQAQLWFYGHIIFGHARLVDNTVQENEPILAKEALSKTEFVVKIEWTLRSEKQGAMPG